MEPSAQDELGDVISLAKSLNSEIGQFNQETSGGSRDLHATMVDPIRAAGDLAKKAQAEAREGVANGAPPPAAPAPMVQTVDGHAVTAPTGLIPLPDAASVDPENPYAHRARAVPSPQSMPPPLPVIHQSVPQYVQNISPPVEDANQMEFGLDYKQKEQYASPYEYFDEKMRYIDAKFDIINAKLTEILSQTKKPKRAPRKPTKVPTTPREKTIERRAIGDFDNESGNE
jgi:hypothetical protein